MPAGRERRRLGLAVADDGRQDEVGVVERCAVGVHERVAELAALVDRAGRLGRRVRGDAARERELPEQFLHSVAVERDVREQLGVRAIQPGVRDDAGAAVAWAGDVDDVEVAFDDEPVEVRPDEVEGGRGAEVSEQAWFRVIHCERSLEPGVVEQVDLADARGSWPRATTCRRR